MFANPYADNPDIPPDFEEVTGRAIYFILDLSNNSKLETVKNQVIKLITQLQTDDRVGVYTSVTTGLAPHQGMAVAQVADYVSQFDFNIEHALRAAFVHLGEAPDSRKIVIVVTDRYKPKQEYVYRKAFDQNVARGYGCKFGIVSLIECGLGGITPADGVLERLLEITS